MFWFLIFGMDQPYFWIKKQSKQDATILYQCHYLLGHINPRDIQILVLLLACLIDTVDYIMPA
jgi:hypothetical protein